MKPRLLAAFLLCAAAGAGVTAVLLRTVPATADPAALGTVSRTPVDSPLAVEVAAPARPALAPAPAVPWARAQPGFDPALTDTPPVTSDMPVTEMLELLGPRARAGDPVAACELSRALQQCRMQSFTQHMTAPPPPPGGDRAAVERYVDAQAARQEWAERTGRRCDGIDAAATAESAMFAARAAVAGHVPSVIDFMQAPMMHAGEFIRTPALADAYRMHMWPLLQRAFAAGNPTITRVALMQLSLPQFGSALGAVLPPQYQDAEAARALLLSMAPEDGIPPHLANRPPPSAEAQATAQRWIDELFAGQLPALEPGSERVSPMIGRIGAESDCREAEAWLR